MIFEVPEALAINREKGREIHFSLPYHPKVYDKDVINQNPQFVLEKINNLGSKAWIEIATPEQPLRAPSGGCLDRITDSRGKVFIPMEKRDEKPGIRAPGFQNPWLGYPDTLKECFDGNYIFRESNTECFVSRKFIPIVRRKSVEALYVWKQTLLIPENPFEKMYVLKTAEELGLHLNQETLKTDYGKLNDRYCIYHQGRKKGEVANCSFSWWPTPDVLLLRQVLLPVTIEEIIIYQEHKREILIVEAEELKGKRFGDQIQCISVREEKEERIAEWEEKVFKPTSSLKRILSQIGIYPKDWLEETRQLLSLKEYDQLWRKDPSRDPFIIENMIWEKGKHP